MSDFDLVKTQVDIVSYIQRNVSLKKAGSVYKASCPFHAEKTPSFVVNPKTQQWKCFGACGVGGSVIDFAMKYHGMTEGEALQDVARFGNIQLEPLTPEHKAKADKRERLYQVLEFAAQYYAKMLYMETDVSRKALSYLADKRGLDAKSIGYEGARLGCTPPGSIKPPLKSSNFTEQEMLDAGLLYKTDDGQLLDRFRSRIMIPLRDQRGRVVGFVGRAMQNDQQPKYLTGSSTELFQKSDLIYRPTSRVKNGHSEAQHTIVVVEGQMDAISALNRGFENVYASMGTALTEGQMDQICKGRPSRVVFCLDKDKAGIAALRNLTEKHVDRLASQGIALYAMFAPHGKDPDDTFREMPHLWQPAVDAARPVVEVLIDLEMTALGDHPTAAQVSAMINDLLPILKSKNLFIEDENLQTLARYTGKEFERLKNWLAPQMRVMDKPSAAPVTIESSPLPTTEEWVLHGILCNEADGWLARANACLFIASDDPMPYALAPLSEQDFTDKALRRFFAASVKAQAAEEMIGDHIDSSLEKTYERLKCLHTIGAEFGLSFDYQVFVDRVYALRLVRLRKERPTFEAKEPAKARECAIGIACIQMAQEDLMD